MTPWVLGSLCLLGPWSVGACNRSEEPAFLAAPQDGPESTRRSPSARLEGAQVEPRQSVDPGDAWWQAATIGDVEALRSGLERGLEVDAPDQRGRVALALAAFDGHTRAVKLLLEHGADPNRKDGAGRTALMYAASGRNRETVRLLLERGADPNAVDGGEGWTALMFAAAEGQASVVELLLRKGADKNLADVDGETALDFARDKGHMAAATLLK